jgi:hypothetical protein
MQKIEFYIAGRQFDLAEYVISDFITCKLNEADEKVHYRNQVECRKYTLEEICINGKIIPDLRSIAS